MGFNNFYRWVVALTNQHHMYITAHISKATLYWSLFWLWHYSLYLKVDFFGYQIHRGPIAAWCVYVEAMHVYSNVPHTCMDANLSFICTHKAHESLATWTYAICFKIACSRLQVRLLKFKCKIFLVSCVKLSFVY